MVVGLTPRSTAVEGAVAAATDSTTSVVSSTADTLCAQAIVYVVRGSGEDPQTGPGAQPFDSSNPTAGYSDTWDAFDPIDPATGASSIDGDRALDETDVPTDTPFMYDLVQKIHHRVGGQLKLSWTPVRYPAVPVAKGLDVPLWLFSQYPNSVTSGIRELDRVLERQWENCGTRTRYVLAGYSQGADVVNSYLRGKIVTYPTALGLGQETDYVGPSPEVAGQIAAVSLVADPNHDPRDPESYSDVDPALSQLGGLTGWRRGVPRQLAGVTDSLCIAGDPVCGQGTTVRPEREQGDLIHTGGYTDSDAYPVQCEVEDERLPDESAIACLADRVVSRLGLRNLVLDPLSEATSAPGATGRDVAFFIDTTGSMSDDIAAARRFAAREASRIVAIDGRVALVEYRDREDDPPVQIVTPFTSDIGDFEAGLGELFADGGGDTPEALLHALMTGFDQLDWQYGATKAAVVLTDAGFHEPDLVGGETLAEVEDRSLQIDPVNIFPVVDDPSAYAEMAIGTSGEVIDKGSGDTEAALSRALDDIAARPVAVLSNGTFTAAAGRAVHFDASDSTPVTGAITQYQWDFDGDGLGDRSTSVPTVTHLYPDGWSGQMQVLVVDDLGRSANASASVIVEEAPSPGLVPRVPGATAMSADAASTGDHVDLSVTWAAGSERPTRWVVSANGDPVAVVSGSSERAGAAIPFQEEAWAVTIEPMDDHGNYGPAFDAPMAALPAPKPWYQRPLVWGAAALGGVLTVLLIAWVRHRRSRRRSATASGAGPLGPVGSVGSVGQQ